MKRPYWLLIGVIVSVLAIVLLAGCVSKSEFEAVAAEKESLEVEKQSLQAEKAALEADKESLQADYSKLTVDYKSANTELAEIKAVYPPRNFSSSHELEEWLLANDVSERPASTNVEDLYSKALEIQEDALNDGFIVSVWIDYRIEAVLCATVIGGGAISMWSPETDSLTIPFLPLSILSNYSNVKELGDAFYPTPTPVP